MSNILDQLAKRLAKISDTPNLDAQVLLAHIVGKARSWILAHPEISLTSDQQSALELAVRKLKSGKPLPYVLGRCEFFGLEFLVTQDVLIPRPETELLVEIALHWLQGHPDQKRVADVGTGSGCIAVTLAVQKSDIHVVATDISRAALKVARQNAEKFLVSQQIDFLCCDILPEYPEPYDLIVANLPYIPSRILRKLRVSKCEPTVALNGGKDGLDLLRRMLGKAPRYLASGGLLLMEIEASQGLETLSLAYDTFSEAQIHLHRDLSGRDRVVEIQL